MATDLDNRDRHPVWRRRLLTVFAHAAVRKLATILVLAVIGLVVSAFGIGKAHAQVPTNQCADPTVGCTEPQAYASCDAARAYTWANMTAQARNSYGGSRCNRVTASRYYRCEIGSASVGFYGCDSAGVQGVHSTLNIHWWAAGTTCANGINPATGQCSLSCPGGYTEDAWNPGQCLDQEKCLARNAEPGFLNVGKINTTSTDRCLAGCEYKAVGGSVCTTLSGVTSCSADMDFSGNSCSPNAPTTKEQAQAEKDKEQECRQEGSFQFCMKKDGRHCYSGRAGRQHCWMPSQTGEQNDENLRQKRDAGNQPIPPNLNLPNGDTLVQNGNPLSTQTTNTNSNGSTTIINTTTTNYTTVNGTNASGTDDPGQGENTDGSEDDGEGGAGGGGDCQTSPFVYGDAGLEMIATQTWATRCAVEEGNAAQVTGNIDDCNSAFTVAGDNANAHKLRAMRKQICPGENPQDVISDADYLGDGSGEPTADQVYTEIGGDFDGWDMSGFGFGNTCPALPTVTVFGTTYDLGADGRNAAVCNIAQILGWFVLLIAGISCLRIVTEA